MADSAVISKELREYLSNFKIEETLTSLVNRLARAMPADPYGYMSGVLSEMSEAGATIAEIQAREVILETQPSLQLEVLCDFKGQRFTGPSFTFSPDEEDEFYMRCSSHRDGDERWEGKGMRNAATLIRQYSLPRNIKESIKGLAAGDQKKLDSSVMAMCENGDTKGPLGINTVTAVSMAGVLAGAYFSNRPLYKHIAFGRLGEELTVFKPVRLLVNLLHTGKRVNTRVKFRGFSLYETTPGRFPVDESLDNFRKIYTSLKHILASGKGGESALRQHPDGGFIPPYDTIADCCKLMDEVVTHAGFSSGEDYSLYIQCGADDFHLAESGKYEMDGFKQPLDVNQLGDYYVKLLNDRHIIGVLEDPVSAEDSEGWTAVGEKLAELHPKARICMNRLISNKVEAMKSIFDPQEGAEPHWRPQMVSIQFKGTVSETIDFQKTLYKAGVTEGLTLREALYESGDASLVDVAFGLQAEFLEVGPPAKWSRLSKFNRWAQLTRETAS